jgi:sulfur-carrier protein adenylyltransferase/sulfurtransferase
VVSFTKLFTPVRSLESDEAKQYLAEHSEGSYTLLDVRQPGEYEIEHIAGAKLIPLTRLKDTYDQLDLDKPVLTYCAIGGRSQAASQLLAGLGFKEVYNLRGGIRAWKGAKATGPRELNLDLVRGDETPAEILTLAYGMELALEIFYLKLLEQANEPEMKKLFAKLAAIEALHKGRILELLGQVNPPVRDQTAFEAQIRPTFLEGGFRVSDFMKQNETYLQSAPDALDLAMMLETQALDLYLRLADKSKHVETKDMLFTLADEEKFHLEQLGQFLETQI